MESSSTTIKDQLEASSSNKLKNFNKIRVTSFSGAVFKPKTANNEVRNQESPLGRPPSRVNGQAQGRFPDSMQENVKIINLKYSEIERRDHGDNF